MISCHNCHQERPDTAEVVDPYDDAYGFGHTVHLCPFCYAHRLAMAVLSVVNNPERTQRPADPFHYPRKEGGDGQVG